jgi:hypothetical protein
MAFKSAFLLLVLHFIAISCFILSSSTVDATATASQTASAEPQASSTAASNTTSPPWSSASSLLPSVVQMFCVIFPAILYCIH